MEAVANLVGILVVMSASSLFMVFSIRNVVQDRPKAWRSAAQETADIVARWAVWVAVVLASAYGLWTVHGRWGLPGIGMVLGTPLLLSVTVAATLVRRRWSGSSERPMKRASVYLRSSPK